MTIIQRLQAIIRQFYDRFDDVEHGVEYYVLGETITDADLIAYAFHGRTHYRIGYTWDDENRIATFEEDRAWTEVEQKWVPVERSADEMRQLKADFLAGRDESDVIEPRATVLPTLEVDAEGQPTEESLDRVGQALVEHIESIETESGDGIESGDGAARGAPAIILDSHEIRARVGETYYRDFAGWDPPTPQITRSGDEKRVTVTINTAAVDRHGTIVLPEGARLDTYNNANPVVLINHRSDLLAATSSVAVRGRGANAKLQANVEDRDWDMADPLIARWKTKLDRKILRSASIGFIPFVIVPGREYAGIEELLGREVSPSERLPDVVTDWELVEWSFVTVPSNPEAVVAGRALETLAARLSAFERTLSRLVPATNVPGEATAAASVDPERSSEAESEVDVLTDDSADDRAAPAAPSTTEEAARTAGANTPTLVQVHRADLAEMIRQVQAERQRNARIRALRKAGRA